MDTIQSEIVRCHGSGDRCTVKASLSSSIGSDGQEKAQQQSERQNDSLIDHAFVGGESRFLSP